MKKNLYQNVIDYINNKITTGEFKIGDFIPSESQLSMLVLVLLERLLIN
jgi:DNA-binding GntR family transcriptional regulator